MAMQPLTEADKHLLEEALARPKRSKPSRVDVPVRLYDTDKALQGGDQLWAAMERLNKWKKIRCQ